MRLEKGENLFVGTFPRGFPRLSSQRNQPVRSLPHHAAGQGKNGAANERNEVVEVVFRLFQVVAHDAEAHNDLDIAVPFIIVKALKGLDDHKGAAEKASLAVGGMEPRWMAAHRTLSPSGAEIPLSFGTTGAPCLSRPWTGKGSVASAGSRQALISSKRAYALMRHPR